MTVRQLGDWIMYVGGLAVALVAIGGLLRYVVVRPLKRWISDQVAPARQQLVPNGGTQESTRYLIEQTAESTAESVRRLEELAKTAAENREIATSALALARETSERLDRHMTTTVHLGGS